MMAGGAPLQMTFRWFVRVTATASAIAVAACAAADPRQFAIDAMGQPTVRVDTGVVHDDTGFDLSASAPSGAAAGNVRFAPHIVPTSRHLQCVPYARGESGVPIYGHAATWWRAAYGVYRRGSVPTPGAVMVFRASRRNPFGHLAVVRSIVNDRKIVVDHANWLNRGRIHRDTPVVDISRANDWSAVRVWYTPGDRLGAHAFPVHGFIRPERIPPGELFRTVVNANVRRKPTRTARRVARLPRRTTVELLERAAGRPWFRIGRDGRELGYVFASLVEPEAGASRSPRLRRRFE